MELKKDGSGPSLFNRALGFQPKSSRTFIFPTGFGFSFAAMAFVLFVLAVGYANNLIYLFVFFLISVAFMGMILTNRNISNVKMDSVSIEDLFANEPGEILLRLENVNSYLPSWDLHFSVNKRDVEVELEHLNEGTLQVALPWKPVRRGWNTLPSVAVKSSYPFGLLRAWQNKKETEQVLIFPERRGDRVLPLEAFGSERPDSAGLFRDHRLYQSSDSPLRVDWKASARRQEILVKNFEEPERKSLQFHWEQTDSIAEFEGRVSQLTLWVDEAERNGFQYSLSLPQFQSPVSRGYPHWKMCLEKLALLSMKEVV